MVLSKWKKRYFTMANWTFKSNKQFAARWQAATSELDVSLSKIMLMDRDKQNETMVQILEKNFRDALEYWTEPPNMIMGVLFKDLAHHLDTTIRTLLEKYGVLHQLKPELPKVEEEHAFFPYGAQAYGYGYSARNHQSYADSSPSRSNWLDSVDSSYNFSAPSFSSSVDCGSGGGGDGGACS